MSGRPVVKGTRVEPDAIIADHESGWSIEEIHERFPSVPVVVISRLIAFARAVDSGESLARLAGSQPDLADAPRRRDF
jgi:uncharacterized protein (DUF433 family)